MDPLIVFKVAFNHYRDIKNNDLRLQKKVPHWAYSPLSPVTPEERYEPDSSSLIIKVSEDRSQMEDFLELAKASDISISNYRRFPYDEYTGGSNTQFSISFDHGESIFSLTFSPDDLLVAAIFTSHGNKNNQIIDYVFKDDIISPYQENVLIEATIYMGFDKFYEGDLIATICLGCLVHFSKQGLGSAYINKKLVYSGQWMNDNFHGTGVLYSDKFKYEGFFNNNNFIEGRRSICNDQGEWLEKDWLENDSLNSHHSNVLTCAIS